MPEDIKFNRNKHRVEFLPNFTLLLQDMESKTASEQRDATLQAQINQLVKKINVIEKKVE